MNLKHRISMSLIHLLILPIISYFTPIEIFAQKSDTVKIWNKQEMNNIWSKASIIQKKVPRYKLPITIKEINGIKFSYPDMFRFKPMCFFSKSDQFRKKVNCGQAINKRLIFNKCVFYPVNIWLDEWECGQDELCDFSYGLFFRECEIKSEHEIFNIAGINSIVALSNCKLGYISLTDLYQCDVYISVNTFTQNFFSLGNLHDCNIESIANTFLSDTTGFLIRDSKLDLVRFTADRARHLIMSFERDSLTGLLEIEHTDGLGFNKSGSHEYIFSNCYIDCGINITLLAEKAKVKFYKCKFGPNAFLNIAADTITFDECMVLHPKMNFKAKGNVLNNGTSNLVIRHTSFENIEFDYLDKVKLHIYPTSKENDELNVENFENLLSKFEKEHKKESYKRLHIEYFKFNHGEVRCFLNRIFWYYGFKKIYILGWISGLWLFFFFLNCLLWKCMLQTYPILKAMTKSHHLRERKKMMYWPRRIIRVASYTSMIFFSLRIHFDKLNYAQPITVVYFFIQYLAGIGCLFILVNFILSL